MTRRLAPLAVALVLSLGVPVAARATGHDETGDRGGVTTVVRNAAHAIGDFVSDTGKAIATL